MDFSPLLWLTLGIALLGLEIIVPGLILFWFGLGSIFTALLSYLKILPNQNIQTIVFVLSSLGMLFLWFFYLKKFFENKKNINQRDPTLNELVGKALTNITKDKPGEIELYKSYHGLTRWKAESDEDIQPGDEIYVIESKGITLIVKKK